jgi:hypothetical protein
MEKNKGFGVAPLKNEGMWTNGVETFEKKPEGYEVVTYKTGWAIDEHGNDITDTPEGQAHPKQRRHWTFLKKRFLQEKKLSKSFT